MKVKAWFKIVHSESEWGKVSLQAIEDVDDLKVAIKKKMKDQLKGYDAATLTIKATYNDDVDPQNAKALVPRLSSRQFWIKFLRRLGLPLRKFGSSSSFHLHLVSQTRFSYCFLG